MAVILRDSAVVVVVRTRPRIIPLAMITMRKSTPGFLFLSYMSMGLSYKAIALRCPDICLLQSFQTSLSCKVPRLRRPFCWPVRITVMGLVEYLTLFGGRSRKCGLRDNREHMTFCKVSEDGDVDLEGRRTPI